MLGPIHPFFAIILCENTLIDTSQMNTMIFVGAFILHNIILNSLLKTKKMIHSKEK